MRDIVPLLPTEPANELQTRPEGQIKMVVVHWDGGQPVPEGYDPTQHYIDEALYHIRKNWCKPPKRCHGYGLMYHEKIDRWGRAYITRPAKDVVWAANVANAISYNICVDATTGQAPTAAQMAALKVRLDVATAKFAVYRHQVWGHGELTEYANRTVCPGEALVELVRKYRRGD